MKKPYSKPTAEKLAFRYRDQIVAASTDRGSGESPSVGTWYGSSRGGDGCRFYLVEALGWSVCYNT